MRDFKYTPQGKRPIRSRLIKRVIPIIILALVISFAGMYMRIETEEHLRIIIIGMCFALVIILLTLVITLNKVVKSNIESTFSISDECLEHKGEMIPYKKFKWTNVEFKEKKDGSVDIYDMSKRKSERRYTRSGIMTVFPELEGFNEFTELLKQKSA